MDPGIAKADQEYIAFLRCAEKNPGVCQCKLARCKDCGYTKHDKMYHMDHSFCTSEKKERRIYFETHSPTNSTNNIVHRSASNDTNNESETTTDGED